MGRINWKDLPSKETPITAENLDKLNNLAIDTSVGEHEEEVVLVKNGKNIFTGFAQIGYLETTTPAIATNENWQTSKYIKVEPNTTYVISSPNSGITRILRQEYDNSKRLNKTLNRVETSNGKSFTTSSTTEYIRFSVNSGTEKRVQVEKGTTATSYVSYVEKNEIYANGDKYTDTLNIGVEPNNSGLWVEHSKNLINNNGTTQTISGITFTNNNGVITANGTATAAIRYYLTSDFTLQPGTYILGDGINSEGGERDDTYFVYVDNVDLYSYGSSKTITTATIARVRITIRNGQTLNNVVFKPMLEKGTTKHSYEPYTTPSIKVNNNGVYETIVNKNVYSSSEVVIGEFMGKPLYRRMIYFTISSTINAWNTILNIPNCDIVIKIYGAMRDAYNNAYFPLPMAESGTYIEFYKDAYSNINEKHSASWYGEKNAYVVVEYTKTTD